MDEERTVIYATAFDAERKAKNLIEYGGCTNRWESLIYLANLLRENDFQDDVVVKSMRKDGYVVYPPKQIEGAVRQDLEIRPNPELLDKQLS